MFVLSSDVCLTLRCLFYPQMFVLSSDVYFILRCLFYPHMFVLSSDVCLILRCLFYPQISVSFSDVCFFLRCLFYPQMFVLSLDVCLILRCLFYPRFDEGSDVSQALAFCLATFFRQNGFAGGRNSSLLEACPSFICKDKKLLKYKLKKVEDSRSYKVRLYDVFEADI